MKEKLLLALIKLVTSMSLYIFRWRQFNLTGRTGSCQN
jgi:hypothetical protein